MKNNVIKAAGIQIFCNTSKQGMLEKAEIYRTGDSKLSGY